MLLCAQRPTSPLGQRSGLDPSQDAGVSGAFQTHSLIPNFFLHSSTQCGQRNITHAFRSGCLTSSPPHLHLSLHCPNSFTLLPKNGRQNSYPLPTTKNIFWQIAFHQNNICLFTDPRLDLCCVVWRGTMGSLWRVKREAWLAHWSSAARHRPQKDNTAHLNKPARLQWHRHSLLFNAPARHGLALVCQVHCLVKAGPVSPVTLTCKEWRGWGGVGWRGCERCSETPLCVGPWLSIPPWSSSSSHAVQLKTMRALQQNAFQ